MKRPQSVIFGILLAIVLLLAGLGFHTVGTGKIGIVVSFGKVVGVEESGLIWRMPIFNNVRTMKVTQTKVDGIYSTSTRDMQTVQQSISIQYSLDVSKSIELYRKFLNNHEAGIILPSVAEAIQSSTAEYTIEELVGKRNELAEKMLTKVREKLDDYGINIIAIDITDHDFSDSYEAAVEAKKVAEQQTLQAKQELEKAKIQAEINQELSKSYDDNVKFKMFLERWDGKLPTYMGGDNELFNLLIPKE